MKKIFFGIIATLFLWSTLTNAQTLKTSTPTEDGAIFVPTSTIKSLDNPILKDVNYSKFYVVQSYHNTSTKLNYSFEKVESKDIIYIVKTVYDENKNIKTIAISSNDSSKLTVTLQTGINQNLANRSSGCTIYGYSLWGCIKAFLGLP